MKTTPWHDVMWARARKAADALGLDQGRVVANGHIQIHGSSDGSAWFEYQLIDEEPESEWAERPIHRDRLPEGWDL
jgi:hypothetical protein